MSSCTPLSVRTGALVVVFGLGLASAAPVWAAEVAPTTVRAVIGADGKVVSVARTGGVAAPAADALPITMAITGSQAGGVRTTNYHVENTTSKTEDLQITQPDGSVKTVQQTVQTPYVAQLHVSVPASLTDVVAPGAEVVANADGSRELTWSMVLFSPVGSPISEVSFTSKGSGAPTARLDSVAVSPNGTAGLGATGQAANAALAGNGTLGALTAGANDGLTKLAAGVGQIVAGLEAVKSGAGQLRTGLAAGADGTNQLAAGLHSAHTGSGQLASGLGQIAGGTGKVAGGTDLLHHGTGQLVGGLAKAAAGSDQLVNGSQDLATGAGLTAAGAASLSTGLNDIRAGVGALPGTLAKDPGFQLLKGTIAALEAAIGSSSDIPHFDPVLKVVVENTLQGGLNLEKAGLANIKDGLRNPGGFTACATVALNPVSTPSETAAVCGITDATEFVGTQLAVAAADTTANAATGGPLADLITNGKHAYAAVPCPAPSGPTKYAPIPGYYAPQVWASPTFALAPKACADISSLIYGLGLPAGVVSTIPKGGVQAQTAVAGVQLASAAAALDVAVKATDGRVLPGIVALNAGLNTIKLGLSNTACDLTVPKDPANPCGVKQILVLVDGGIDSLVAGISANLGGFVTKAYNGSVALASGTAQVAAGAGKLSEIGAVPLSDGLAQLLAGGRQLDAGVGALNTGAQQLNAGVIKASDGATALDAGIGKISAGEDKLAAGLPAAVTGSAALETGAGKLLDGSKAVGKGLGDVKTQATGVLASQLAAGTNNAKVQLAALDATSARLTSDPSAVGTTYVLTQNAAGVTTVKASGTDHTMRNIGIAAGGALLLLGGLGAGFLSGRRQGGVA